MDIADLIRRIEGALPNIHFGDMEKVALWDVIDDWLYEQDILLDRDRREAEQDGRNA